MSDGAQGALSTPPALASPSSDRELLEQGRPKSPFLVEEASIASSGSAPPIIVQHPTPPLPPRQARGISFSKLPAESDGIDTDADRPSIKRMAANELGQALLRTATADRLDDALARAAQAAREELREFASSKTPKGNGRIDSVLLATVLVFRWPIQLILPLCTCGKVGFFSSLVRLGGVEKVNTLLTIARFDTANTTSSKRCNTTCTSSASSIVAIDEAEFESQGERLVSNATAGCQNTSVVATLFIATTHLGNIGRPTPWLPSEPSVAVFGPQLADSLMWATLSFNVAIEVGALLLLLYATLSRVLLVYILPTMGARLTFICQSNLPGNLSVAISLLVACCAWVVSLGGLLHSPNFGFLLLAAGPVCLFAVVGLLADYYLQATLLLHRQCKSLIAKAEADDQTSRQTAMPMRREMEGVTLRLLSQGLPPILERSTIGTNSTQTRRRIWSPGVMPGPTRRRGTPSVQPRVV